MGSVLFSTNSVGFEPFYKVGPVILICYELWTF